MFGAVGSLVLFLNLLKKHIEVERSEVEEDSDSEVFEVAETE